MARVASMVTVGAPLWASAAAVAARRRPAAAPLLLTSTMAHKPRGSSGLPLRWLLRGLLGLGVALPTVKVYLAVRPLLQRRQRDGADAPSTEAASTSLPTPGWAWYISEASDRLIRDVFTAAVIVGDYVATLRAHGDGTDWHALHQRGADRLLALCEVNKGIYIKLGQHVGALDYLLPAEYVGTLRVLQHAAPRDGFDAVLGVLREEFPGRDVHDVFERLDPVPIASASLAQVHVGVLRGSGRKVAVKVQHAGLRETSAADIATVSGLLYGIRALFPSFDYTWLADEVSRNLPQELDFLREARNCEAAGAAFAHRPDVAVPAVIHELTTPRVLTMSFEEGVYADRLGAIRAMGLRPAEVATLISEAFNHQIMVAGSVHCDPHAANVLVRVLPGTGPGTRRPAKPQLVLLDHGLYRAIPRTVRLDYAHLWAAIIAGDEAGIREYSARLGSGGMYQLFASMLTTRTWDRILDAADDLDALRNTGSEADFSESRYYAREYAADISAILRQVPRELLLVLKTNDNLRSIDFALGSPVNSLVTTARYVQRALNEEYREAHPGWTGAVHAACASAALEVRLALLSTAGAALKVAGRVVRALGLQRHPRDAAAVVAVPPPGGAAA